MPLQKEVWTPAIQENLYRGIELLKNAATNDDSYLQGRTIHIPNAGSSPIVTRGNTTYPVNISERDDTEVTYNLTNFEIGPVRLGWAESLQTEYDKVKSITNDFMGNLGETFLFYTLSQWFKGDVSNVVPTTGTNTTANWLPTGTGNLKHLTGADVRNAAKILTKHKMPETGRFLLLDYEMFWQLLGDVSYNTARIGVIGSLSATIDNIYGFTVIQLPYVMAVTNNTSGTPIEPNAGEGSFPFTVNSRPCGLAYHISSVGWAKTDIKVIINNEDPTMFGATLSATLYGGGKYRRSNGDGVVCIRATA